MVIVHNICLFVIVAYILCYGSEIYQNLKNLKKSYMVSKPILVFSLSLDQAEQ